jgi:hypothetical protein
LTILGSGIGSAPITASADMTGAGSADITGSAASDGLGHPRRAAIPIGPIREAEGDGPRGAPGPLAISNPIDASSREANRR